MTLPEIGLGRRTYNVPLFFSIFPFPLTKTGILDFLALLLSRLRSSSPSSFDVVKILSLPLSRRRRRPLAPSAKAGDSAQRPPLVVLFLFSPSAALLILQSLPSMAADVERHCCFQGWISNLLLLFSRVFFSFSDRNNHWRSLAEGETRQTFFAVFLLRAAHQCFSPPLPIREKEAKNKTLFLLFAVHKESTLQHHTFVHGVKH